MVETAGELPDVLERFDAGPPTLPPFVPKAQGRRKTEPESTLLAKSLQWEGSGRVEEATLMFWGRLFVWLYTAL